MNIIITDCTDNKFTALKRECIAVFREGNFIIKTIKYTGQKEETPRSLDALENAASERIKFLANHVSLEEIKKEFPLSSNEFYFVTIRKGFIPMNQGWLFVSLAYVGKFRGDFFAGMSHAPALQSSLRNAMKFSEEKRYERFSEAYELFRVKPLIACIDETSEVDWFSEALRGCMYQAIAQQ